MTVNRVNIGREDESLNIANINILDRFNKIREIFPSATRVLSILLKTAATSANVDSVCTKGFMFDSSCEICAEVSSLQQ